MKAFKGFDKNLKCRGFQYEVGKEYEEDKAELCNSGFHACENPLDVLRYYDPASSRFCEVDIDDNGERKSDSKVCGKHIKIKTEIGLSGLIKAGVKFVLDKVDFNSTSTNTGDYSASTNTGNYSASTNTGNYSASTNTGNYSASTNTGDYSASTNTGYCSASTNTGNYSASTNTGDYSASTNTGYCSVSTNTGDCSVSTNTGDYSASTNTGYRSASTNTGNYSASTNTGNYSASTNTGDCSVSTNTGNRSVSTNTGDCSASTNTGDCSTSEVRGEGSVAIVTGYKSKAKANIGSAIVIAERGEWDGTCYPLIDIKAAIIDGVKLKADTFYTLKNGEFVEIKE